MSAQRKEQPITDAVKLAEVRKEVEYRWFVYPKRVAAGKKADQATEELHEQLLRREP